MRAQKTGALKDCSYCRSYACWMLRYKMYEFVLHLHLKWKRLYSEPFQSGVRDSSAWRLPCLAKFLWRPRTKLNICTFTHTCTVWTHMFLALCENNFTLAPEPSRCHWPGVIPTRVFTARVKTCGRTFYLCSDQRYIHEVCQKRLCAFSQSKQQKSRNSDIPVNRF